MSLKLSPLKIKLSPPVLIALTIFYMGAIIFLSISKDVGFSGDTGRFINNAFHVPIFFILTILYLKCFNSLNIITFNISQVCALFCVIIFSLLVEYCQSYTSYRMTSFIDIFSNFIGVILAMVFYRKYYFYYKNN